MNIRHHIHFIALACSFAATCIAPTAQAAYPDRPIRLIVALAPGGSSDLVARVMAQAMSKVLGQPMVVENKDGAGGAIGAREAARASPDGYTLSLGVASTMAANPACRPNDLPYDPIRDFQPVTNFANAANVITINPKNIPAKDLKELIEYIKKNPGKLSYGSSGTCSILHLMGESFKMATGTDILHVPYKGSGPAIAATLAGQIDMDFDTLPSSLPHIQTGKLKAMAISWPRRIDAIKDVPNFAEAGYPVMNRPVWFGLLAPAGTPMDIVNKLRDAAVVALKDPQVVQTLQEQGSIPSGNTPEEYAKEIKELLDWAKDVVKTQNIKLD